MNARRAAGGARAAGGLAAALALGLSLPGCVARPPTIADVHIGHAVTGVHVTPGHAGYLEVAERRAHEALDAARRAAGDTDLGTLQTDVAATVHACDDAQDFGLRQALLLAANHLSFAATSSDASANVIRFAPEFKRDIAVVIGRCDYIALLGADVAKSDSFQAAAPSAAEILKAARANLDGEDSAGNGSRGAVPADYGVLQLRAEVNAMISRERPPYRTVDQWYLFNLVRLPNGRWVFDKLGRGGNVEGYK